MNDELELVRRFRESVPAPETHVVTSARAVLDQAIAAEPSRRERLQAPASRLGLRRRWSLRLAAVAVAAITALTVAWPFGSGNGPTVSPALAATLHRLATIAAHGPSLVPTHGRYLYLNSVNDWSSTAVGRHSQCVTYARQHRQVWVNAQLSGLLLETDGVTRFTSAADKASCKAMKPSPLPATGQNGGWTLWFAKDCWSIGFGPSGNINKLSHNPRVLLQQMRRYDGGSPSAAEDFVHVGDALRETDASPQLRAAIFQAAELIPGVKLLGTVHDGLGRSGIGLALIRHHGKWRDELIFNPKTAAMMAEYDGGGWAMYYPSKLVSRMPRQSPIPLTPACVKSSGTMKNTPEGQVMVGSPRLGASGLKPRPAN